MEIVGKTLSDAQIKRRLLMAAYLVVAVPASGLLWELLSPARQLEPQPWLPMRDALAPLPETGSSLTPPAYDEEEASAQTARARIPSAQRGRALAPLTDKIKQLIGGRRDAAHAAYGEHAAGVRGRLGAIAGPLNRNGGGGQSGAGFSGSHSPAPTFASAGPLNSVGLVTIGASKRFSPARLQRSGRVNGFMGTGRPGGVRMMNATTLEPEFRSAASGGIPGFSAAGQPQAGGAASVGGEVGMGEGNRLDDRADSSSSNPALPLNPLPEVPDEVDAMSGGSGANRIQAAACEAFSQGVVDSSALLEKLRAESKKATDMLRRTADKALAAATSRNAQELKAAERTEKLIPLSSCPDAFGNDRCANLRQCLVRSLGELDSLGIAFARDIKQLRSAQTLLKEAPPAGEEGFVSALAAIATEEGLRGASDRYFDSEKGLKTASVPDHLSTVAACRQSAASLPSQICVRRSRLGCVQWAGLDVGSRGLAVADLDRGIQEETKTGLDKSWCGQIGASCQPLDEAALLRDLSEHNEALQVWAEQAPKEPLDKTADAARHLGKAAQLLKTPAGHSSRDLVNGSLELERAADALGDANQEWITQRDAACKGVK